MFIKKVISILLVLSVLAESTFYCYQDCVYAEIAGFEINFSEIDDLKESDTEYIFHCKDYSLSPCTVSPALKKSSHFHFSESAPDDACTSVASPPPEVA